MSTMSLEAEDTPGRGDNAVIAISSSADIAYPAVNLDAAPDPIAEIIEAGEFALCVKFFAEVEAARDALMGPNSQALLFCTIRNLKPEHVFEIGTYKASTTEAICRALHANGRGILHTVDPFGGDTVPPILERWPSHLKDHVCFYPVDSMAFYAGAVQNKLRPGVVFVDGNHDYEFALFDIECAARLIRPDGFVFINNVSQPGPYFAAVDFLSRHPHWREHGSSAERYRPQYPFDRSRTAVPQTDFCVLRAPRQISIGIRPMTPGEQSWTDSQVRGISVSIARPATGALYVQCVFRTFGSPPSETTVEQTLELSGGIGDVRVDFDSSFRPEDVLLQRRVEPWLTWDGEGELELTGEPTLY
jgi:hypothetical protein